MKTSPAFSFYPTDFIMGTMLMTAEQVGVYIRLLCFQWEQGSVPSQPALIAKVAGIRERKLLEMEEVLAKFETGPDGRLRNAKMEKVREEKIEFSQKQSQNGSQGGRGKKSKHDSQSVDSEQNEKANALPEESQIKAKQKPPSPSPLPSPNTPLPPEGDGLGLELDSDPVPQTKPWTPTEDQLQINSWFRRRPDTRWSEKELRAFRKLPPTPDEDWHLLERYYLGPGDGRYPRQDVFTLLNNWQGEIDRARKWSETNIKKSNGRASLNL